MVLHLQELLTENRQEFTDVNESSNAGNINVTGLAHRIIEVKCAKSRKIQSLRDPKVSRECSSSLTVLIQKCTNISNIFIRMKDSTVEPNTQNVECVKCTRQFGKMESKKHTKK